MRVRTHTNPFNYYHRLEKIVLADIFKNTKCSLDLEIGFGRGVFLRNYAQLNPERNIIGVEIRKVVVEILQKKIAAGDLHNVFLVHGNGEIFLEDALEDNAVDRVFIFHPDPWFKKRHYKRRVINEKFLETCVRKMKNGAKLYLSTDVAELWEYMEDFLKKHPSFSLVQDDVFWQTYYQTHWQDFSQKDHRSCFLGVFQLSKNS
ncbi:tRNA (guanosine(46)-N7)-methyltransferase TrmB [bacterium]|nr:tRNA (guanosine(46)-N7)-methyltransferase TrmB [bacterium]MBT4551367.1 tRNA (guanosine(46)-N7)-methyltransferase TrmB [bacterium]